MKTIVVALALSLLGLMTADSRDQDSRNAGAAQGAAPAGSAYTLVLLKTGPKSGQLAKDENDKLFAGHFANMERMSNERKLVIAGPYGEKRHDPALRGIFVLDTAQRAEAEAWGHTDPPTQAGVFVLEFHDLASDAPLRAAHEAELARVAKLKAEGKTPKPGDGARTYVLLTAEKGDVAWKELAALLTPDGGVYLLAHLDGMRALALLDAKDLAEAKERFAPQLEHIGACSLDEWFASAGLAHLVDPKPADAKAR